ncbi:variant erythrocyte surface antigen-1, alpha subunit, partial [Babesia divergens]
MYYTYVFVGQTDNNIDKLKDALKAELPSFDNNSDDLTQLVQGLCLFMGYPSCVCSLKLNVDESLKNISQKLIQDFKAVKSSHSNLKTLNLNCDSCIPKEILCKCCVIRCIKELRQSKQSKCNCVKNASTDCKCKDTKGKCCKDVLSGLEACLSLLNLKTDLAVCTCNDTKNCCKNGTCTNGSCPVCDPDKFPDNAMTGLGICPMNPRKLAEKLEEFFGQGSKSDCSCKGSPCTCCCLACQSCSSKNSCFCSSSGCSCDKAPKKTSPCPRKKFCEAINSIKVPSDSSEMTCCNKGQKCHCSLAGSGSSQCSSSGNCCVVPSGGSPAYYHSLKCLIRRLVNFFNGLSLDSSKSDCSKLCCEIFCVLKISYFLKDLFNASKTSAGKKSCEKCKGKGP